MARSTRPAYRIEYTAKNFKGDNIVGWKPEVYGKASAANLATYCGKLNASFAAGGVNAHISEGLGCDACVSGAQIVNQNTGAVVATWAA